MSPDKARTTPTPAPPDLAGRVHIFGIRHHGPGSSRSLRAALQDLRPDIVLVEGPPEGNDLLPLVASPAMQPPVALLVYAPGANSSTGEGIAAAAYYPFTEFSPEWQAIHYALANHIPVRLIDLPLAHQMAMLPLESISEPAPDPPTEEPAAPPQPEPDPRILTGDPLNALGEAAGYSEGEQWWEHLVEQRRDPSGVFAAILEAMTALRQAAPPDPGPIAARREAAMRQAIRAALDEGCHCAAVVCGAWHSPALVDLSTAVEDSALLRGLPRVALRATWVPWTYARLTRAGGYGAGIESPGWYEHLWTTERDVVVRWMINVARLLRGEDVDVSSAHIIEAVRLAEGLAALRDRPLPGLPELNEAVLTVFCFGNPTPLRLIEQKLIIGEKIGSVPPETPMAPLQQDFDAHVRRLRLPIEATERFLDLDLRKPTDLERSHLLHRLALIGVGWAQNSGASLRPGSHGRGGTFHEVWRVRWQPEYAVQLIEAGQWGNTIAGAATARVCQEAARAPDLASLTALVEDVLLAELPDAIREVMANLQTQAAVSSDVNHLMLALPPLADVLRYGNVRQTDSAMITGVVDGLVARICIGLGAACSSLNDDAAAEMFTRINHVDDAILRLSIPEYRLPWLKALEGIAAQENVHGLLAGRACRILLDQNVLDAAEAARRLGVALSPASEPLQAAAWLEGFLRGSGALLIHDSALLDLIDAWLTGLPLDVFNQLLPLLRRTFAAFSRPERRAIGARLKGGPARSRVQADPTDAPFDEARANAILPLAARLLGIQLPEKP